MRLLRAPSLAGAEACLFPNGACRAGTRQVPWGEAPPQWFQRTAALPSRKPRPGREIRGSSRAAGGRGREGLLSPSGPSAPPASQTTRAKARKGRCAFPGLVLELREEAPQEQLRARRSGAAVQSSFRCKGAKRAPERLALASGSILKALQPSGHRLGVRGAGRRTSRADRSPRQEDPLPARKEAELGQNTVCRNELKEPPGNGSCWPPRLSFSKPPPRS